MKISEAIKFIVDQNDKELLTDSNKFTAYLLDLCSDNPKELKIVKRALEDKILERIFGNERDNVKIARLRDEFEDQGMTTDWSEFVISSFAEVLGWNYTPKVQNQEAQSQSQKNQQTQNQSSNQTNWICSCGFTNTTKFCGNCGLPKPIPKITSWTCSCGFVNTTKFCGNCGKSGLQQSEEEARKRDEAEARKRDEEESRRTEEQERLKAKVEARKRAEEERLIKKYKDIFASSSETEEERKRAEEEARRKNAQVGDYIKFGEYPQTRNGDIQPIEWLVLSKENNKVLVISKYGLEAKYFNSSSNNWKNSKIRQWLNGEFYNIAFNENEKKLIRVSNISTTVYEKKKKE